MNRALLVGQEPAAALGYTYVTEPPFDAVVIGSLTISGLLNFGEEPVLQALSAGQPVLLYEPGIPQVKANRGLAASLSSKRRELKNWGVIFTDGGQRKVITAAQAQLMRANGERPAPGAVLTPLAKEILNL